MLPTSAPIDSPARVIDAFVDAWNQHDMAAFDLLFTDDASWTTTFDARIDGRDAVIADFREAHAGFASDTAVAPSALAIRRIRPDVAVIQFNIALTWPGDTVGIGRTMLVVAVDDGASWRIAAGQITKPNCP